MKKAIVGYGEIWVDEQEKDIEFAHLIINPEMRNKGLGKVLVNLLEEEAKSYHFSFAYMRVYPGNMKAISCYKSNHFEIDQHLNEACNNKWIWFKKSIG